MSHRPRAKRLPWSKVRNGQQHQQPRCLLRDGVVVEVIQEVVHVVVIGGLDAITIVDMVIVVIAVVGVIVVVVVEEDEEGGVAVMRLRPRIGDKWPRSPLGSQPNPRLPPLTEAHGWHNDVPRGNTKIKSGENKKSNNNC